MYFGTRDIPQMQRDVFNQKFNLNCINKNSINCINTLTVILGHGVSPVKPWWLLVIETFELLKL
ncbi:hypothetical protein M0802_016608 [Mischocyttarus mexicanus]|nr:hypothetical protein M0802_016611 [Mischocyttarus mexicanus]KAI4472654.1 hypothetical protein M0802_016608 [Mischocyttarus mexicanus]